MKNIKPIYLYNDPFTQRNQIYKDLKKNGGIYLWTNLLNDKKYVGSSVNLSRRLKDYFKITFLEIECKKNNSHIYRALLKYGFKNFRLEIIELCDKSQIIEREQYYLDNLELKYNILKVARSLLGFKHSEISKEKMRLNNIGKPFRGNRELLYSCSRSFPLVLKELSNPNNIIYLPSIRRAALYLNISPGYLSICLRKNKFYKGRNYYITLSDKI